MSDCDVLILGAGPYGLSAAAYLRAVKGLEVRVFGEPMSFWEGNMPAGMLLRSGWAASHIADPERVLTLDAYKAATGAEFVAPLPVEHFVGYGRWFQQQVVPELDRRKIARIDRNHNGFRVDTADGQTLHAGRVMVASGIAPFAWRPPEFDHLPRQWASHAADHRDLRKFRGRRVMVVGGGQSALESAALLHEAGAHAEVLVRESHIHWLGWQRRIKRHVPMGRLLYSPHDVGPAGISQLVARPNWFTRLPRSLQDRIARRCIRPAGSYWLRERLRDVPLRLGRGIRSATLQGEELNLVLDDGSQRKADHLLFGTGYRIDVTRYPFLAPGLVAGIASANGHPILTPGFESSVPGLHFLGAPGAYSFGPLLRFVSGTNYVGPALKQFMEDLAPRALARPVQRPRQAEPATE